MLGMSKSAKMAKEVAALRAGLDAEIAQSLLTAQILQGLRAAIEDSGEHLRRAEERAGESAASLSGQISQIKEALDALSGRITSPEQLRTLENRMLRLEKRLDEQAEDLQGVVAGLVARIDGANRSGK